MNEQILKICAQHYLQKNSERFTQKEKQEFIANLQELFSGNFVLADEVYDFLVEEKLISAESRHKTFANYITSKYPLGEYKKVLDVGAGRLCHLSQLLANVGYEVYAIDPKIRLSKKEAEQLKIKSITKLKFACDEYSTQGTPVDDYDFLIGLEPCDATEHIIRQGLKHNKPFDVLLCYAPHSTLTGQKMNSVEEWYNHLKSISNEIKIINKANSFIATNNP